MPTQSENSIDRLFEKDVTTDEDVCRAFEKDKRTIQRWTRQREIPPPARKIGNKNYWTRSQWLNHFGLERA